MIKLSKHTQPLLESTPLDVNSCKLVGEFAGTDVHLLRGSLYYVLESGQHTFVKTTFGGNIYGSRLGENRHIHVFEVLRRTPCSYVAKYNHTLVICHCSNRTDVFKFRTIFQHLLADPEAPLVGAGLTRRFFPNRKLDIQKYLNEYVNMKFKIIPNEVEVNYRSGNFHLDLVI